MKLLFNVSSSARAFYRRPRLILQISEDAQTHSCNYFHFDGLIFPKQPIYQILMANALVNKAQ